jgi:hypothetical protein
MDQRYQGLLDMLNGGGAGRAGQTFEGGGLSGLLNSLGIRPMGYQDRLAEARPQPNPMLMTPTVSTMGAPAMQPPVSPYAPGAITQTALPPMLGQMSTDQLRELIMQLQNAPPTSLGYGPR